MYNTIVAILTWLAASPAEVDLVQPRAAACCRVAYSMAAKKPMIEEEEEVTREEGTPTAQTKPKRMVKRCVNGRCVITYE